MKKNIFVFIIIAIIVVIACIYIIKTNKSNPSVDSENLKLIYETSVSPNENFIEKKDDKVIYTIKVYKDSDNIKVVSSSNSSFAKDISYEINSNNEITEKDINIEWQTIMGDTNFTKENQMAAAIISISSNGEIISQRKVNFISKAIDIIVDTINKNR